jgi:ABC-2 type transport system ATP-binding protein
VTPAAIQTRRLSKTFGRTLAVSDLSLSVAAGEVFGFLGPNGAGKTTSIKMLLALVAPTSGGGEVLGQPIGDRPTRARIGFLPEHFRFHESLTARELLRFHGRLHGVRGLPLEHRLDRLLARMDLIEAADRPLRGYSKGMIQRAGLAQALINEPDLVFLDEPTSGLDPLGRLLVRDIIGELRARGVTVFLNSHLLSEVEATCDRVAFVKQGAVVHELALAEAAATMELEIRVTPIDGRLLTSLQAHGRGVVPVGPDRVRLQIDGEDRIPLVVRTLVEHGRQVYDVHTRRKSLEEWFVEVMGDDQRPG